MNQLSKTPRMSVFLFIWFGEMISLTGSGLTRFALGVWVYTLTGSATQYALIAFSAVLPAILLMPVAGALVDRWDRRRVLLFSNAGAGCCSLIIALLLLLGQLNIWEIYILTAIGAALSAFQWPAFMASITLLAPRQQIGRATGMVQFAQAASLIIPPALAGLLIGLIQMYGVVLIDVATFLVAMLILAIVRFPGIPPSEANRPKKGGLLQEIAYGLTYITTRPGLLALLLFFAVTNFLLGIVMVLITPLILSFADRATLGWVLSTAATGMLAGGLVMSVWGGPRRRVHGVLVFTFVQGAILLLGGLRPNALLVCVAAWIFLFANPIILGSSQAIWQSKTDPAMQGRLFATRRFIASSVTPLAYLIAGPLIDYVFWPLTMPGTWFSNSIGRITDFGIGHGIGLLFILMGILTIGATCMGYLYRPLRLVEDVLPDAEVLIVSAETGLATPEPGPATPLSA